MDLNYGKKSSPKKNFIRGSGRSRDSMEILTNRTSSSKNSNCKNEIPQNKSKKKAYKILKEQLKYISVNHKRNRTQYYRRESNKGHKSKSKK
mmetsp:Transcript_30442/g.26957  ORF Transcript_30442/g.26957 Transcript_30442/m.26957 type:complete len:92 (+) Transcript_30442:601-876(+)